MTRFRFAMLAALLAPLPLLFSPHAPMVDLPQHAAQVAALMQMFNGEWAFQDLFYTQFFLPYLTGLALIGLFAQIVPIAVAAKLTVALALGGLVAATAWLLHKEKSDPAWVWLLVPASYGFAFNWGFLNFLVAAPLGVLLLQQSFAYARSPSVLNGIGLAVLTHVVFFSHVMVLLYFGLFSGLTVLARSPTLWVGIGRAFPLWSVAGVGLVWGLPGMQGAQAQWPVIWNLGWHRVLGLPELITGEHVSVSVTVLASTLFLLPVLGGARLSRDPWRVLPFLACLVMVFCMPLLLAGTYFSYQRFALFLLPTFLFALESDVRRMPRVFDFGLVVVALFWTMATSARFAAFADESRPFEAVLDKMQPGRRALSLVFEPTGRIRNAPTYLHYPVWYQAEKIGLVEFNFAKFQGMPLQYRDPPAVDDNLPWYPQMFDWNLHRGMDYDYIVVHFAGSQPPFNSAPTLLKLVLRSGDWWLYERADPVSQGSSRPRQ